METKTLLLIILAGIAALLLALFQYVYKSKRTKLHIILTMLRFVTYFAILILLINPKFEKSTFYSEKPNLVVAVDNSESVKHLDQDSNVHNFIQSLKENQELNNNFNLEFYTFGTDVKPLDSLQFNESRSNISKVFSSLEQVYKNSISPLVVVSDGNQTYGVDYEFSSKKYKQPINSVILGDTITYSDLKIQQLNVNKYAYLKNQFPVEIFVTYIGNASINSQLIISSGNSRVYSKNLNFSKANNSQSINLTLPANRVGVNAYTARIVGLPNEKNTINNTKPFAVEVIDEKTNVAIVSTISHPDIGTLKKSIESNEQRSVSIITPNEFVRTKDNYQLAILYQPNSNFKTTFDALNENSSNKLVITGSQTEWTFLNSIQSNFEQEITRQTEVYQAEINTNYNAFIINDLDFSSFPPLKSEFGSLTLNVPYDTILYKQFGGSILPDPLLLTFEVNNRREAVLIGESVWRWRAQSYLNIESFQEFDDFIGKLVQYLASSKQRKRLNVNYESFYNGNGNILITSQFFNKNYEFDNKASLEIILKNIETNESTIIPFIIKQNNFEVDLSGLTPAEYNFTVRANDSDAAESGTFTILNYNVEQQFLNANVSKLQAMATTSQGSSYFVEDSDKLVADLMQDSSYAIIQKSTKNVVPLIDFKLLLALIALSLATEWFVRKYNGLI